MFTSAASRKRLSAWLALCAMWLAVCMPAASQMVASLQAREPVAELCSGLGVTAHQHEHEHAAGTLARCGYCDLLNVHSTLPGVAATPLTWLPLAWLAVVVPAASPLIRLVPFRSGHPRDPPRHA
jgi:hypothetical protein